MKLTTVLFLITGLIVVMAHFAGLGFYLYWYYWWFDILMHFWAGVLIALCLFTLQDIRVITADKKVSWKLVLLVTLMIAVAWEIFEYSVGITALNIESSFDTISDIIFGLLGAVVGYYVGIRIRQLMI